MIASQKTSANQGASLRSLQDAYQALLRNRKKAILFFAVTLSLVVVGITFCPKTYMSEAKLFVRVGRESVTLDPTATTGQTISVYESRESEINSVLDVLESRLILEAVVDKIGPENILNRSVSAPANREKAVRALGDAIHTSHAKKSSVISISCKARSPELAQEIVQAYLAAFQEQHLRVNRTSGSYEFFVEQAELQGKKLTEATLRLRDAKNEFGLTSIEGQRKAIGQQQTTIEAAVLTTEAELASSRAAIEKLKKLLADLPERLLTQEIHGSPNSATDRTRQQLYELQIREQELLAKYTEKHPLVVANREQAAKAGRILAEQQTGRSQATQATNPARMRLEMKLLEEESRAAALAAKVTTLRHQADDIVGQQRRLNDHEGRISELKREVELLQLSYRTYAENLEQARIDQELGAQHISNVNVVQPASFITRPIGPKKRLILALGLIVATLGGIGLAIGTEYFATFHQRQQPEQTRTVLTVAATR